VILAGILSGVTQSLTLVVAVSKGFLVPIPGDFNAGPPPPLINLGENVGERLLHPLGFSYGIPGYLVLLVMFASSFLTGYALADFNDVARSLLISLAILFSLVPYLLLGFSSRISALPENLQTFFFLAFIVYFFLNLLGSFGGAVLGEEHL